MTSNTAPLAVAFANTLSSTARDRIATVDRFKDWASAWPGFAGLPARLSVRALADIRAQRDATQLVLHHLADHSQVPEELLARATWRGLIAAPFRLLPVAGGGVRIDGDCLAGVGHLLGRAVVDFLLSPYVTELRRCDGARCRKVFLSRRVDGRWCDSRVCGNRARVAAHARRHGLDPMSEGEPGPPSRRRT